MKTKVLGLVNPGTGDLGTRRPRENGDNTASAILRQGLIIIVVNKNELINMTVVYSKCLAGSNGISIKPKLALRAR
jgi:hypothetical protein